MLVGQIAFGRRKSMNYTRGVSDEQFHHVSMLNVLLQLIL